MKNEFLSKYDDFAANAFDLTEVFMLNLFRLAIEQGMSKQEAKNAVKMYIVNRFGDQFYVDHLVDVAAFCDFVYPGV